MLQTIRGKMYIIPRMKMKNFKKNYDLPCRDAPMPEIHDIWTAADSRACSAVQLFDFTLDDLLDFLKEDKRSSNPESESEEQRKVAFDFHFSVP